MGAETLVLGILVATFVWGVLVFNLLVRDRNRVRAAWSDIDVQLKRRHDLLPKLVEAVKQYAAYEQATLTELAELRTRGAKGGTVGATGTLETAVGAGVRRLIALVEAYPDLKANQSFLMLQRDLTEVEETIQYARRYYNGAVRALNTRIDSVPDTWIAAWFEFRPAEYFELDDEMERES